ncbi:MAG: DUF6775 family putative metallopeptidase [Chloroflexota bacterium]|nr:DUF6775 family putative metallopeptidase [Chloroflexota bacterium]
MKTRKLNHIILYNEGVDDNVDLPQIASYLKDRLGRIDVEIRSSLFSQELSPEQISFYSKRLASARISSANQFWEEHEPLYGEVEYEKRSIQGKTKSIGILYEGIELQLIYSELVPQTESNLRCVNIVLTKRLFATWDNANKRYHARVVLLGIPSLISTTGIIEAPAKPRDYYILKQQYEMIGKDLLELGERFSGQYIDYDDDRMTEIIKGYAMQSVFYYLTGTPFCQDSRCRLFNAHWQDEMISAQLHGEYELCPKHAYLLSDL